MRGLTLHSFAKDVVLVSGKDNDKSLWWMVEWSLLSGKKELHHDHGNAAQINVVSHTKNNSATE